VNRLYYGDNLEVLRSFPDECVDLIYLDPPFNSNAGYNVLWSTKGAASDASIEAFDDTWTWGDSAKDALMDIAKGANRPLQVMMEAMRTGIGENPLMAYLAMMAVRLVELHRVLRDIRPKNPAPCSNGSSRPRRTRATSCSTHFAAAGRRWMRRRSWGGSGSASTSRTSPSA